MTQPTRVVSSAKQRRAGTGKQRAKRQPRGTAIERQLARRRNRIAGPIHQSARGQAGRAAMHRDIVGKVLAGWMTIRGQAGRAAMHRDCQTAVPLLRFLYCGSFTAVPLLRARRRQVCSTRFSHDTRKTSATKKVRAEWPSEWRAEWRSEWRAEWPSEWRSEWRKNLVAAHSGAARLPHSSRNPPATGHSSQISPVPTCTAAPPIWTLVTMPPDMPMCASTLPGRPTSSPCSIENCASGDAKITPSPTR